MTARDVLAGMLTSENAAQIGKVLSYIEGLEAVEAEGERRREAILLLVRDRAVVAAALEAEERAKGKTRVTVPQSRAIGSLEAFSACAALLSGEDVDVELDIARTEVVTDVLGDSDN